MSTRRRQQPTFVKAWADLPPWVRPGARLFEVRGGYEARFEPRTVIHITSTQIVCVEGHDPNREGLAEYRYRRSNCGRIAPGKSDNGNVLADPNSEHIRNALAVRALVDVYQEVRRLHDTHITKVDYQSRPRTVEQATERLGEIADLVREALNGINQREDAAERQRTEEGEAQ